jgi:hypothetical protein
MGVPGKSLKVSSFIAALCIMVYIVAIAFGAVQIILNMGERQNLAEREFYDLADRATSSSVFLGFMTEAYQATIRDFLSASDTLLGIILTSSSGEYAFEKFNGSGIVWTADSPRFKTGLGLSGKAFFLPLGIEGQRNVTIQANYGRIDYAFCQKILRQTLLAILSALIVAFITLLVERTIKNRADYNKAEASGDNASADSNEWESQFDDPIPSSKTKPMPTEPEYGVQGEEEEEPKGLYNPRGNIGWDSYTNDRLSAELHRCSSFEQDLVFLAMELTSREKVSDSLYSLFTDEAANLFSLRDLIFGKGDNGIAIIMPNADLDEGISRSERFHSRIISKLRELSGSRGGVPEIELNIGLSSRSGRLIEADRLILEANSALEKAIADPVTYIVAFRSDPEKYREFIKSNKN